MDPLKYDWEQGVMLLNRAQLRCRLEEKRFLLNWNPSYIHHAESSIEAICLSGFTARKVFI